LHATTTRNPSETALSSRCRQRTRRPAAACPGEAGCGGGPAGRSQPWEAAEQQRRHQEGQGVEDEHARHRQHRQQQRDQQRPRDLQPVGAGAEDGVGALQLGVVDQLGDGAARGRLEGGGEDRLCRHQAQQHRERRQQQRDRADRQRLAELAGDHRAPAARPVGDHPEQRAEQRGGAVGGQQQQANADAVAGLLGDQQDQGHQPDRVADQRDHPGQPQPPERARPPQQPPPVSVPGHAFPEPARRASSRRRHGHQRRPA